VADRIAVPFSGHGSGTAPLTWAQLGIWQTIERIGRSSTIGGVSAVPPGTTVERVVHGLRFVVQRHPSLRTRLTFRDGRPWQHVAEAGEVELEVVDAADDPAAVAAAVADRYLNTAFDHRADWPVRMAAVRHRGEVTHSVAVYSHLAVDGTGIAALVADLATMDPATGTGPPPPEAVQPLDLAARQSLPAAQRQSAASLRHWERVLRTVAPVRLPRTSFDEAPRMRMVGYRSPAARQAVHAVAARLAVDSSPVLLAAFAVALARVTGVNPVVPLLSVSNRFRPGLAASVSQLAQSSPCVIDVDAPSFDDVVARARKAAMGAYLHAYYDPAARTALMARVARDRGVEVDLGCTFNDRRRQAPDPIGTVDPAALTAAATLGEFRTIARTDLSRQKLYLGIDDVPGAIDLTMSADTRHLPPPAMESLLRTIESVLVAAALTPQRLRP
jgi:hypothetical protein